MVERIVVPGGILAVDVRIGVIEAVAAIRAAVGAVRVLAEGIVRSAAVIAAVGVRHASDWSR